MRRTKIIATIGPASDSDTVLDALIESGMDVARLNFSHGSPAAHAAAVARIRDAARRAGRPVAILQDLSGPKIRTGRLEGGEPLRLDTGDTLRIVTGEGTGRPGVVYTAFDGLAKGVGPGDRLLVADGAIELHVTASDGVEIETTVVEGGVLGERKGINAPGVKLSASAITPKDVEDLRFGVSVGVDLVGVSFVRTKADLLEARRLLADMNASGVPIVAKLERPEALDDLEGILDACDAVMVARGDLGLEMPLEKVPTAQKRITIEARRREVPVIVATQVLESMTHGARPTRAEVSDAANAVADGVDAIMLAGETAVGLFPSRAVRTLDAIVREAEASPAVLDLPAAIERAHDGHLHALCQAAVTLAERARADAIVAVTRGGATARHLAALRPKVPIVAATDREETARRLAICWGITPVAAGVGDGVDVSGAVLGRELAAAGLVEPRATLVFVNVHRDLARPDANFVTIQRL
jgi:pyruvate kinase